MFLDAKDLAVRKLPIRKSYAPGSIDYQTAEIKQVEPLEVNATAELLDGQIRIAGEIETKVELVCARCLEPVVEEVSRTFDLFYSPLPKGLKPEEARLKEDDVEIGFFEGEGLFLADVLREQVLLALPMKAICRSDCRGMSELPRNEAAAPGVPALWLLQGPRGSRQVCLGQASPPDEFSGLSKVFR